MKSPWLGSHSPQKVPLSAGIRASAPCTTGQWNVWSVHFGAQEELADVNLGRCKALLYSYLWQVTKGGKQKAWGGGETLYLQPTK